MLKVEPYYTVEPGKILTCTDHSFVFCGQILQFSETVLQLGNRLKYYLSDMEDIYSKPDFLQEQLTVCLLLSMMLVQLCYFIYFNHIALLFMVVFCGNSPVILIEF